ncbi:hypothetical protein LGAS_0950 [Lactobacillus gasseri ATCC 33323 = JCM 1131]|uniref:Uncharacterized protein n=1 Tax=Lactobacillus gasseri (strain ATCC 33323 / DSM 20243 / BCRC 14619 / CIP 102991 / JCM 1131 / KCTC 3163 / NCIMB 11718 / NCTC 13722 / AM63) TaxID=324831 RepID=A0A805ZXN0_LACGA|nr:hypothetical protein LGAS_0950 [Lactobacillus gasseri ATCC 33323 = JCM 1131]
MASISSNKTHVRSTVAIMFKIIRMEKRDKKAE